MPPPPLPAPPALTPTERVLLLGAHFAGPGSMLKGSHDLLTGGDAALNPLAETLFRVAFLALEAEGFVRLQHTTGRALFGLRKTNAVTAEAEPGAAGRPAGALEEGLLGLVAAAGAPVEVDEVVYRWFDADHAWPHRAVPPAVLGGLVARGLVGAVSEETRGLLGTKAVARHVLTPEAQAALAAGPAPAQALLDAAAARGPLGEHLDREVKQGLRRRTYRGGASADYPDPDFG